MSRAGKMGQVQRVSRVESPRCLAMGKNYKPLHDHSLKC